MCAACVQPANKDSVLVRALFVHITIRMRACAQNAAAIVVAARATRPKTTTATTIEKEEAFC